MKPEVWNSNMDAVIKHLDDCNDVMDSIKAKLDLRPQNANYLIDDLNKLIRLSLLLDTVTDFLKCDLGLQRLLHTYHFEVGDEKGEFIIQKIVKETYDSPLIPRFRKMLAISEGLHLYDHNAKKFAVEVQQTMATILECYQNEFAQIMLEDE